MLNAQIDLRPAHREMVETILAAHIPSEGRIGVFGSRVKGKARRGSDLDLVIELGRKLTFRERMDLEQAFEDSDLPIRVDVVDWQAISDSFKRAIEGDVVWG